MRLSTLVEGYWLERRRDVSPHTFDDYDRTFRRFQAFIGDPDFREIQAADVRRFLNHLADQGLADKTLANVWIALSALWSWAERELGATHVIRNRVQRPRWRRPQIEPYSVEEVKALLAACELGAAWRTRTGRTARSRRPTMLRDRAILVTLVDTGVRAQELCDLCVGDYDRASGRLHIRHGKGDKPRVVFVGDAGRRCIWRYLAERDGTTADAPLFATANGTHLSRDNLLGMIQTLAAQAGVEGATVHRFRHTFAVTFLRNGGSVLALQSLLGHEQMETIRIYAKLAAVDLHEAQRSASPADNWRL